MVSIHHSTIRSQLKNKNIMKEINLVFDTKNNSICVHKECPNKEQFIAYAKELESWDNLYVSLKDGSVYTFRNYLLNLMEH
jgi:hypothetical protein